MSTPAVLASRIAAIVSLISEKSGEPAIEAYKKFITSQVYVDFTDSQAGFNALGSPLIAQLYIEETQNGSYYYPEFI